jgi:hypothetical protein
VNMNRRRSRVAVARGIRRCAGDSGILASLIRYFEGRRWFDRRFGEREKKHWSKTVGDALHCTCLPSGIGQGPASMAMK